MDSLLEVLLELIFQLVGDLIVDTVSRSRNPIVHVIANSVLSVVIAAFLAVGSLTVYPHHVIRNQTVRLSALLVIPVLNGVAMSAFGRLRAKHGRIRSEYEYFVPAFLFSVVFGAIRFAGAK